MTQTWAGVDVAFVERHYDKIARFYNILERLFGTPGRARRIAIERLELKPGYTILELGCGGGKNMPLLHEKVGEQGWVVGVDISKEMLKRAWARQQKCQLHRSRLFQCDALKFASAVMDFDAILFCLSYHTMPHRREVLAHAWKLLRPGGRLVIMDARPPPGLLGRLTLPLAEWLVRRTVLGNPHVRGWEHLYDFDLNTRVEEFLLGSYYVASACKA